MYPVSDKFLAALRKGPTLLAKCDFMAKNEITLTDVPLLSGEINDDISALIRRRATISLSGETPGLVLPEANYTPGSPLWPVGNEIKLHSGIRFDDGTEEWIPEGVFRIARPRITRTSQEFSVTVDCWDRGRQMSRNRFTDLYWIAGGTNFATAIKTVVLDRMPMLNDEDMIFMETEHTTPWMVFVPQDDPWEKVTEMATSLGAELFFDNDGKCVLRELSNPLYTPSTFEYAAGDEAIVTEVSRDLDDEEAYNGVIATGANNDNYNLIPRGEAWDLDPNSPTYFDPKFPELSTYGAVPFFYISEFITTDSQAKAAAEALLLGITGVMEQVTFTSITNPAQAGGDVISIVEPDTGVDNVYILEQFRKGLGYVGNMSGTTRKRRAS